MTTTFANNNSQSGNMFDVLTAGNALNVTAFDVNLDSGTWGLEIYSKTGSYVGSESTPTDWTLISTINSIVSAGEGAATFVDSSDFFLPASSITGLYIRATTGTPINYTNGTSVGNIAASNSDLTIFEGVGVAGSFGSIFTPRIWNGTIHYDVAAVPVPAAVWLFGSGLLGLLGYRKKQPS